MMAEHTGNHQLPGFIRVDKTGARVAYFAILLTAVFALLLIFLRWFYTPAYVVLIHDPDTNTLAQVSAELQKNNIAYQYDSDSDSVLVPEKSLYHARFVLGAKNPEQNAFSQLFTESVRQDAGLFGPEAVATKYFSLETELAKTISSITDIQWARVHLAVQSENSSPGEHKSRASVFVRLVPGRVLVESQLTSIAHLVASSVPNLSTANIAIIDQAGNLLKSSGDDSLSSSSTMHYSYTRMLEQTYINKIESLLTPIFGKHSVRVKVDADVDFTASQQNVTQPGSGIPVHSIKKLSATVVVDNKRTKNEEGRQINNPRSRNELEKIETMVKESIGYDAQRGDRVDVFNESFGNDWEFIGQSPALFGIENKLYFWKESLVALFGLLAAIFLLKYALQKVVRTLRVPKLSHAGKTSLAEFAAREVDEKGNSVVEGVKPVADVSRDTYETVLARACQLVNDNPAHVASILKSWVRDNGR